MVTPPRMKAFDAAPRLLLSGRPPCSYSSEMPDTPETPDQQEISLAELSEAFAQAIQRPPQQQAGCGEQPELEPTAEAAPGDDLARQPAEEVPEQPEPLPPEDADDICPISPSSILEAMLFVGDRENRPLTPAQAAGPMRGVEPGDIPALVEALNSRYESGGSPYRIVNEGAGYRLSLARAFYPLRDKFYGRVREARLSQAAIEVLAIVAYQQPLTAEDVARMRGTPSGHILSQLVRRQLLRIERNQRKPRVALYYTAARFLDLFGLESLEDLPQSEELDRR